MSSDNYYFWPQNNIGKTTDYRPAVAFWILVLTFLTIIARLFFLQILQGPLYLEQAQENTTYILTQAAPRGIIYDRDHRVLASNKQSPSIVILPSVVLNHDISKISEKLSQILGTTKEEIKAKIQKLKKTDSRPYTLKANLSIEQVAAIYENRHELPGITVQQQSARYYVHGDALSHVIGYTGQVNADELKQDPDRRLNDLIGKYGIEKVFDAELRGQNAYTRIKVNRHGQPLDPVNLDEVASSRPVSGKDITLTIDLDLQKAGEEAMKDLKGAAVVIDVRNGEILALVSKPSFDPNLFTSKVSDEIWRQMNSRQTFINRALSAYPPGSIWKPLVLLVALETKAVKPNEKFAVNGAYYWGGYRFGDWTNRTGVYTLQQALAWSRDTAFYQMAVRMKDKDITHWGKKLGALQPTGIEFKNESLGCLPDEKWKSKNQWYPGNTLHYSIGQGPLLMTPLQAARLTAGLATSNRLPKLHLIKKLGNKQKDNKIDFDTFQATPEAMRVVHEGMIQCVESGTCQGVKLPGISIGAKTGSAEAPPNRKTHGWITAYAPANAEPEIVVVAFAEAAGHGGTVASPIAKVLLEKYFEKYHNYKPNSPQVARPVESSRARTNKRRLKPKVVTDRQRPSEAQSEPSSGGQLNTNE